MQQAETHVKIVFVVGFNENNVRNCVCVGFNFKPVVWILNPFSLFQRTPFHRLYRNFTKQSAYYERRSFVTNGICPEGAHRWIKLPLKIQIYFESIIFLSTINIRFLTL